MKKEIRKVLKDAGRKVAVGVATHYANISCPLVFYQPKMKDSVKKLRKF